MELYGSSVLDNSLHNKIGQNILQKSQSAVWNQRPCPDDVTEHDPVMSTDALEKPRRPKEMEKVSKVNVTSTTDPHRQPPKLTPPEEKVNGLNGRRSSCSAAQQHPQNQLRRTASQSALHQHPSQFNDYGSLNRHSKTVRELDKQRHHQLQQQQQQKLQQFYQVPPCVVKDIVITVLKNQGIINITDEILQQAMQEYYEKNPQGVSENY